MRVCIVELAKIVLKKYLQYKVHSQEYLKLKILKKEFHLKAFKYKILSEILVFKNTLSENISKVWLTQHRTYTYI